MSSDTAAAALLTGMLSATLDPLDLAERLRVPPVFEITRGFRGPLDLDADVFRYRILSSGRIVAVPAHGRACWTAHAQHARRR